MHTLTDELIGAISPGLQEKNGVKNLARFASLTLLCFAGTACTDSAGGETGSILTSTGASVDAQALYNTPTCGDAATAALAGVDAPIPPSPYTLPDLNAPTTHVVDSALLLQQRIWQINATRLPNHVMHDIVVEDGVYTNEGLWGGILRITGSFRIWAETSGGVEFKFGAAAYGYNPNTLFGPIEIHGINFTIDDPATAVPTGTIGRRAVIANWGRAEGLVITDSVIEGNYLAHYGLELRQSRGLQLKRVMVRNMLRYGVMSELPNAESMDGPAIMEDIVIDGVGDTAWQQMPICGSPEAVGVTDPYCPGTAEIGIWIGEETTLNRAKIRNVFWAGVGTASNGEVLSNVVMRNLDIDGLGNGEFGGAGTAIYFERTSNDMLIENFCFGEQTERGMNAEWDHYITGTGAQNLTVQNGVVESWNAGIYFDYGATNNHLANIVFRNAQWAPVGLYKNHLPGGDCSTTTFENLTFENLGPNACADVVYSHYKQPCGAITQSTCD